jgi:hypothetical protein
MQQSRMKIHYISVLLVLAALVAAPASPAFGGNHSCKDGQNGGGCQFEASCSGDEFRWTGACSIQCYDHTGNVGEIVEAGTASCGSSTSGGGDDDCTEPHCGLFSEG